jgi:hypothetical protein
MTIIIIGIVVFIIFKVMSKGGARSLVSIIFDHYLSYKKSIKFYENGSCEIKGGLIFKNQKQAKIFILNLIFLKRMNDKDKASLRFQNEIEAHGKIEKFTYDHKGKENWAHLFDFSSLGDVITTIWYIESGLRATESFGEFPSLDYGLVDYDEYSSKVITKEYKRLCASNNIDETEDII